MKHLQHLQKDFQIHKGFKLPYKGHEGGENPYWSLYFVNPSTLCDTIESAETTLKQEDLIDSFWNNHIAKKRRFYNTFLCKDGVAYYEYSKRSKTLAGLVLSFDDNEFTKKLPKTPFGFYRVALEKFLDRAKRRLENGEQIELYFDGYAIEMSKNHFSVDKEGKRIIENFIDEVVYNDLNEVVVNPYAEFSVHLHAPKTLYDFFQFYLGIRDKKLAQKEIKVPKRGGFAMEMGHGLLYIIVLFGLLVSMWVVDARLSDEISPVRMAVEGFAALAIAEVVHGILKSKAM